MDRLHAIAADQAAGRGNDAGPAPERATEHRIDILHAQPDPNLRAVGSRDPRSEVRDYSKVLEDAYVKVYPTRTKQDAEAFADLFGLKSQLRTIFREERENGVKVWNLDGAALRGLIGDVNPANANEDAGGESSLKAIIATLLYSPQYSDQALANLKPQERPRLNAVADESEQGLEYLELAKKLAKIMGIEVRIIAVPTDATNFNPSNDVAIVDLQTMQLTPATGTGPVEEVGRLKYVAVVNGAKRSMDVPVTKETADAIATSNGSLKPLQKAAAALVNGQEVGGRRNE